MSFVTRNRKRIWAVLLTSSIPLFLGMTAISFAPPTVLFSASIALTAAIGITLAPITAWLVLTLTAVAVTAILSSLFAKWCMSPSTPDTRYNNTQSNVDQPTQTASAYDASQQQAYLATQIQNIAPPQYTPPHTLVPAGDPTETTRGTEVPAYLKSHTGVFVDQGYYNPQTNMFTSVLPKATVQNTQSHSNDLTPVYMQTAKR